MIQQKHLTPYPTPETIREKAITVPNKSVDPTEMLKRMAVGSIENRAALFYEKQGMTIPNFHLMDRIEKLEHLAEYRKAIANNMKKLQEIDDQKEKVVKDKQFKQKVDEEISKRTGESGIQSGNAGQANPDKKG